MLDSIEFSLSSASGWVKKSEKKLVEAKEDHGAAKKVIFVINIIENLFPHIGWNSCSCYSYWTCYSYLIFMINNN